MRRDKWIIDGNYNGTLDIRFCAAELVIFLDINRLICMWSAFWRRGKKRSDLPEFLKEPKVLSRDFWEFNKWIWDFPKSGRPKIIELHEEFPEKPFVRLASRRQMGNALDFWENRKR